MFEAIHRFTGQRHAVKVGSKQIPEGMEWKRVRLLREARALGQIRHPNIVAITDAGVSEGFPFVAMELLEGRSLEGLLTTRGRFSVSDAVSAALQICDALAAAHAVGVLHRDVKPGNMIVVRDGDASASSSSTSAPRRSRTPRPRRSPRPARSSARRRTWRPSSSSAQEVDERVDVYAVGAMLFECLTRRRPLRGRVPARAHGRVHERPASLRPPRASADRGRPRRGHRAALSKKPKRPLPTIGGARERAPQRVPATSTDARTCSTSQPPPAQPRRKFNRAPYRTPSASCRRGARSTGRCEDISEGGMLLLSDQACEPDEEVSVRFALPIEGRVASCKARVQWVRARPDRPYASQAIGLEFLDAPSGSRASLARYVTLMTGDTEPVEPPPVPKRAPPQSGPIAIRHEGHRPRRAHRAPRPRRCEVMSCDAQPSQPESSCSLGRARRAPRDRTSTRAPARATR